MNIQQRTIPNIPATIAVNTEGKITFRYEYGKALIENDGSAIWNRYKLVLAGVEYQYGVWYSPSEELKQYLNGFMDY